ncbi:MAG: C40 family peptidase, partial [Clostridiales bacterium]|nr:C40 family peptidase [Clostridiales bacterium]
AQQLSNGSAVTNLQVGDLVFFNNTYSSSLAATHVGIYTGDNQFIHAAAGGVKITDLSDSFYASRYVGARRIF